MPRKQPDPAEVAKHDEVTRTIIVGHLCALDGGVSKLEVAAAIMHTLRTRGYAAEIVCCNGVRDGRKVRWV